MKLFVVLFALFAVIVAVLMGAALLGTFIANVRDASEAAQEKRKFAQEALSLRSRMQRERAERLTRVVPRRSHVVMREECRRAA